MLHNAVKTLVINKINIVFPSTDCHHSGLWQNRRYNLFVGRGVLIWRMRRHCTASQAGSSRMKKLQAKSSRE